MPEAAPPDWVKLAVGPQVESSLETSKSAEGAVAVMLAVRLLPLTATEVEAEAVPVAVERAAGLPVTAMLGLALTMMSPGS